MQNKFQFPKGFFWGAATSAHQVEGGNHNDWTEWELKTAKAHAGGAKNRKWPDFIMGNYPNPLQKENYISGKACDHYNRFREDFDIARSLGHNAHRFSIEWSRIEPEEGKFNEKEIEHYREVIRALRERGIEPFVTLWHWTNPVWLAAIGGWQNKKIIGYYVRYAKKMAESFPEVRFWITHNEQEAFARHGYFLHDRPPAQGNILDAYLVLKNLKESHKLAYAAIKKINPAVQVGFSESLVYFESYNKMPHNWLAMRFIRWWRNNAFLAEFAKYSDFIGLQYYFHSRIRLSLKAQWGIQFNENKKVSDFGWEIYPEGIYNVLKGLKKYNKPIYITENGLADTRDTERGDFIREHLRWVSKAISDDIDVRGYLYWSLLDNFEWQQGFWPRFGLVEIDYRTMERKIRPSAWEYKKIIENQGFNELSQPPYGSWHYFSHGYNQFIMDKHRLFGGDGGYYFLEGVDRG